MIEAKPRWSVPSVGPSKNRRTVCSGHLDRQEQRRLALVHLLIELACPE